MPYTVIQVENAVVTEAQLAATLPATGRFAPADAAKIARESFGLFIERLERKQADAFQAALRGQGVATKIIEDDDLFTMPPVKATKRFDCVAEHLVVYDALGRPRPVAWSDVLVVAAGEVSLFESQTVETKGPNKSAGAIAMKVGMAIAVPGLRPMNTTVTTRSTQGQEVPRLVLDIIVLGDPSRYRGEAQEMNYTYLAKRQGRDIAENFATLVSDIMQFATTAVFNQGAVAMMSDAEDTLVYPSRKAFEREIIWLVWSASQPG